jgi:hypothetical protein
MFQNKKSLIESRTKSNYENSFYDHYDNNMHLGLNKNNSYNNPTNWKGSYYTVEKSFSENNFGNNYQRKKPQTSREFSIYDNQTSYSSYKNKNYKTNENKKGINAYNKMSHVQGNYDNFYNSKYQSGYNSYNPYHIPPNNFQEMGTSKKYECGAIYKPKIMEIPISNSNNNLIHLDIKSNQMTKSSKAFQSLQALFKSYEGMCNFILFAKSCSVHVLREETHLIDDIKIINFFKNFEKVSAFGLDTNYPSEGK